jgi:ketosteroid isomerase-like protein
MSQENLQLVRQIGAPLQGIDVAPFIRAGLEGDAAAIPPDVANSLGVALDIYDPDFEIDASRVDMPGFGVFHGLEGMRELWRAWIEAWERYSWMQSNWSEVGDHVIADVRIRATGKSSGADVVWDHCQVWTFRDGTVVRWLLANDRAEALKAVGLEE